MSIVKDPLKDLISEVEANRLPDGTLTAAVFQPIVGVAFKHLMIRNADLSQAIEMLVATVRRAEARIEVLEQKAAGVKCH